MKLLIYGVILLLIVSIGIVGYAILTQSQIENDQNNQSGERLAEDQSNEESPISSPEQPDDQEEITFATLAKALENNQALSAVAQELLNIEVSIAPGTTLFLPTNEALIANSESATQELIENHTFPQTLTLKNIVSLENEQATNALDTQVQIRVVNGELLVNGIKTRVPALEIATVLVYPLEGVL